MTHVNIIWKNSAGLVIDTVPADNRPDDIKAKLIDMIQEGEVQLGDSFSIEEALL